MNSAYCFQSSLILYFLSAAGRTFQHGSSSVTLKLLAALLASLDASSFALVFESDGVDPRDACPPSGDAPVAPELDPAARFPDCFEEDAVGVVEVGAWPGEPAEGKFPPVPFG